MMIFDELAFDNFVID